MEKNLENMSPDDPEMTGCCENPLDKRAKDFAKEADDEIERIKKDADKANRDVEDAANGEKSATREEPQLDGP